MIEQEYIEQMSVAGDEAELLRELERATNLRVIQPKMVSGRAQGALLTILTRMIAPQRVLEIGTFTGYSALAIAAGLESQSAELHTIEVDDELEEIAQSFFNRSRHGSKIRLHIGSALEVALRLGGQFDMVFVDGDKREYPLYWQMLMGPEPMVRRGGIILTDNVLWYGKVAESEAETTSLTAETITKNVTKTDNHTAGIAEFNRLAAADVRVENVILPLRDGLNLIRLK